MKRSIGLILAGGLTALVVIIIFVLGFAAIIPPSQAGANQAAAVDVAATAQAIQHQNQQTESQSILQEREAALQAQIQQSQQAIGELDSVSQAQLAKMRAELVDLTAQIEQVRANNQGTQAHIEQIQQTIQNDDVAYQNQVTTLQTNLSQTENQMKQEMETATAQLQAAYDQLAQRQAVCNIPAPLCMSGGSKDLVMNGQVAGASRNRVAYPKSPAAVSGGCQDGPARSDGSMSTRRSGTSACNARPAGGHLDNLDVAVAKSRGLLNPSQLGPRRRW